ncbi:lasso RiPP family leader peptide-containing protein [Actinosynnema sp. CS-041913]|uniref:lasso RiPP family leader peptide-containing protein n=1 Tax=Actinosynnema sp. CS-041913 TaxID=3239917 RepID=UPI003D932889
MWRTWPCSVRARVGRAPHSHAGSGERGWVNRPCHGDISDPTIRKRFVMQKKPSPYVKPALVMVGSFASLTLGSRGRDRDSRRRQKNEG